VTHLALIVVLANSFVAVVQETGQLSFMLPEEDIEGENLQFNEHMLKK
jgi:hypothetical protein